MPVMGYLAVDRLNALTGADFVRLGIVTPRRAARSLPSGAPCADSRRGTATTATGTTPRPEARAPCAPAKRWPSWAARATPTSSSTKRACAGQFRHQYFLLFLIPHFHKAALVLLSDRLAGASAGLDVGDTESIKRFKRRIRQLKEIFLRFTHRYWFHEVTDQAQARALYRMAARRSAPSAVRRGAEGDPGHERVPGQRLSAAAGQHGDRAHGGDHGRPHRDHHDRLLRHESACRGRLPPGAARSSTSCWGRWPRRP